MKERVSFFLSPEAPFDPKNNLKLSKDSLRVSALKAAREDHFTFGFDELPQEIWLALRQCHEFRLRWSSSTPYTSSAPLSSRLSPGLHIFYTPQREKPDDLICPTLQKAFGQSLPCESPNKTFTAIPVLSERFASSAAYNYYHSLKGLDELVMYILQKVCHYEDAPCTSRLASLVAPDFLDVDWDVISQTLVIKTYKQSPFPKDSWEGIFTPVNESKLEIGVLTPAAPVPALLENLALAGYISAVGKDDTPDSVEFTFAARHHEPAQGHGIYSASFLHPTGLHPTLRLSVSARKPPAPNCHLHAYLTLPSVLFPDKYQLAAPLFLASKNLGSLRAVWGETDLEAPDWAVSRWGSSMLIELVAPKADEVINSDIPLHLRYLTPTAGGMQEAEVPWPVIFWACRAEEGAKMGTNPFDRVNLGYDGLFGPKTMFYHLQPNATAKEDMYSSIHVPVLDSNKTEWLQTVTAAVLLGGLTWVLWKLFQISQAPATEPSTKEDKAVIKKKN